MQVKIILEAGYSLAILGLSLSYNQTDWTRMQEVAEKLAKKDPSESKFLRFIQVYLDITAPRFWWQEFDTYAIGCTRLSSSTMHTITKRELTVQDFEREVVFDATLEGINMAIREYHNETDAERKHGLFLVIKHALPEGFLQRRIVCLNYATLRNILAQRHNHRLPQWQTFCGEIMGQCEHPEYLEDCMK